MVPQARLELARLEPSPRILSPVRLPISPPGQVEIRSKFWVILSVIVNGNLKGFPVCLSKGKLIFQRLIITII